MDSLKEYLSREEIKDSFSEKEKEFLISQWENLKTPFYYEYAEGWKALLDSQCLPTLMTLLVVILGTLAFTIIAVVIPFALSCAPMFLGRIPIFTRIVTFLPNMLLRVCTYYDEFLLCEIDGKVMGVFTLLIPLYLTLCIVTILVLLSIINIIAFITFYFYRIKGKHRTLMSDIGLICIVMLWIIYSIYVWVM